jgi:probable HAF family extracellular repeat protein
MNRLPTVHSVSTENDMEVGAMAVRHRVRSALLGRRRRLAWVVGVSVLLSALVSPGAAVAVGVAGAGRAAGHELPAGPLATLDGINDHGVVAGSNTAGHAALWDARAHLLRDLGLLPGSYNSQALAIDKHGNVAGVSRAPLDGPYQAHAFRWTAARGMVDLGTLGGTFSSALAMNDRGLVVGYSTPVGDQHNRAFAWSSTRGIRNLGVLSGMTDSVATDVNTAGQVTGYTYGHGQVRAFRWSPRAGMIDLGSLGGQDTQAWEINDHGAVVGTSTTAIGAQHVFRWTAHGGMIDLGTMGLSINVRGLTETGVIAGFRQVNADGLMRAFLYTPEMGFQDLGLPTNPQGSSFVNAMNDRRRIVGQLSDDGGLNVPYRTFIWQADPRPPQNHAHRT